MVCATYIDKALFNVIPLIFATLIDQRADSENHLSHIVITRAQRVTVVRTLNQNGNCSAFTAVTRVRILLVTL
jgi:hypothetical protein